MIYIYALIALFVVLNGIDAYTTWHILTKQNGTEANGLLAKIMAKIGIIQALAIMKLAAITVLTYALLFMPALYGIEYAFALGLFANAIFVYVVIHNLKQYH